MRRSAQERADERWAEQEAAHARQLIADAEPLEKICEECGNDLVCEGHRYCTECLERLFP